MKEMTLGQDGWFWSFIGLGAAAALISLGFIIFSDNLTWCGNSTCFTDALEIFKFPIQAFTAGIALATLRALVFRSEQTAKQIENSLRQIDEAKNQNTYKNYFDHKKDFYDFLASLEDDFGIKFRNVHEMYGYLFPKNTPNNFSVLSHSLDSSKSPLEFWVEKYNAVIASMKTDLLERNNSAMYVGWLRHLVSAMDKVKFPEGGFSVNSLHDKSGVFIGFESWNNFPDPLYISVERVGEMFEALIRYCLPGNTDVEVSRLRVNKDNFNKQLEYVVGDFEVE